MNGGELPALWEAALMEQEQDDLDARRAERALAELWETYKDALPWEDAGE